MSQHLEAHKADPFGVDWIQDDEGTDLLSVALDLSGQTWRFAVTTEEARWLQAQLEATLAMIDGQSS